MRAESMYRVWEGLLPAVNANARGLDVIVQIINMDTYHMLIPGVNEALLSKSLRASPSQVTRVWMLIIMAFEHFPFNADNSVFT